MYYAISTMSIVHAVYSLHNRRKAVTGQILIYYLITAIRHSPFAKTQIRLLTIGSGYLGIQIINRMTGYLFQPYCIHALLCIMNAALIHQLYMCGSPAIF